MKDKLIECFRLKEPERSKILRSGLLSVIPVCEPEDQEVFFDWLIKTLLYSEGLKMCNYCGNMVHYIGTYADMSLFRCMGCGAFYFISEYNELEGFSKE